jgi:hypothetical protein
MARRGTFNRSGHILDAPTGVDPSSWAADNLLTKTQPIAAPLACQCPPTQGTHYLGGCKPGLRWVDHLTLSPICLTCQKALIPGRHRRRDQVHMIGLSALPIDDLDLADLREWGVLASERPAPEESDPAMAWPRPAAPAQRRGPAVPDPDAIAAAATALEQAEAQQEWLEALS